MKRYSVCKFPSFHGTAWNTNSYVLALLFALVRIVAPGISEIRIIDNQTGEHPIVWVG